MIHDYEAIARIVQDVVSRDVTKLRVVSVRVRPQRPDDDPDQLDIMVIVNGDRDSESRRQLVRAIGNVRNKLESEIGETAFPVFSFVSDDDEGLLAPMAT